MSKLSKKKQARDHRPKVISSRTALNGLNIVARQSVLWPCHAFNISIPQKKKSTLNVFEEIVLKITDVESGNTEKIAQLTCLENELVAFIQNRLNQLGFLNERYELSKCGQDLLSGWQNESEEELEYSVGTVFVDLLSGKLLSYVSMKQLSYKKIEKIYSKENHEKKGEFEHYVNFFINPTDEKWIRAVKISPAKDSFWKTVPSSNDIIRAIRELNKKYKRHALLNQDIEQYPPQVPLAEAILVHETPELVYLHCHALIQKGNADLLVTDGCGFGFSENFANYLISQDWQWLTDLKQKGVVDKIGNAEGFDNKSVRKPFKYAEISRRIKRSESALQKIENLEVSSTNYERDYKQGVENGIKSLYAALEWALRQVVAGAPAPEWEEIFSEGNFRDNEKLLIGLAKKVGFAVNEKNRSILQVKPGAIRQIERGKVELQPLLALSIVGANCFANHPVHRLAQNHSGFLNHALRLKRYRDPIEHGSTEMLNVDDKTLDELVQATVPMIVSLVPDIVGDINEVDDLPCTEDVDQERLKADLELDKALGRPLVSNLIGDIKEQLIRSEIMLADYSVEKTLEIIKCYASIIQHALFDSIRGRRVKTEGNTLKELAFEKIVLFGFSLNKQEIPKELTSVAENNVRRAVQGTSSSVAANLLALFLLGSERELILLQKSGVKLVRLVSDLHRLRGHGNQSISEFSQAELDSVKDGTLKNNVFKLIKIIMEIF